MISARKFNEQLWIETATTITATIGAFALVPGLEVRGAVYALILAGSVRLVLSAVLVGKLISRLERTSPGVQVHLPRHGDVVLERAFASG